MIVLANDGISQVGVKKLENNGFKVITTNVAQEQLIDFINKNSITCLLVRSATKVRKDIIDSCKSLKLIGRGGVGMDNIDVEYAKTQGLSVINTPAASSISVAELVFAHIMTCSRFLHDSNRNMPLEGDSNFKKLKKNYSKGSELKNKTLGIIGFGRIGQEVAKIGYGCGMNIIFCDHFLNEAEIKIIFSDGQNIYFKPDSVSLDDLLNKSDYITLHVPSQKDYLLDEKEFSKMKDGVGIINAARGGVLNEESLIKFIDSGKIKFAGLDTFENEPNPSIKTLMNSKLSLTPHIGAATNEAQERIGLELADQIISLINN
ncbi:MAG: 3-phosphoglycerate dehydrogenase [Flavobacteriaceae bacterium]|nr:3-phosphoglycerate dehydrogenase [Flavobacteriaceae bacterium]